MDTYGRAVCKVGFLDQQQEQNRITSHEEIKEIQTFRAHTRSTESETELAACALTKPPGDYDGTPKLMHATDLNICTHGQKESYLVYYPEYFF